MNYDNFVNSKKYKYFKNIQHYIQANMGQTDRIIPGVIY